jgi:transposase
MIRRHELTDEQWERLKPLLPPQKAKTGRPAADHRRILNGILTRYDKRADSYRAFWIIAATILWL